MSCLSSGPKRLLTTICFRLSGTLPVANCATTSFVSRWELAKLAELGSMAFLSGSRPFEHKHNRSEG